MSGCDVVDGVAVDRAPPGRWTLRARGTVTIAANTIVEVAVLTVQPLGIPLTLNYVTTGPIDAAENVFGSMNPINSILGNSLQQTYRRNAGDAGTVYRVVFLNGWAGAALGIAVTVRFRSWEVQP